jgi:hypothetical protein
MFNTNQRFLLFFFSVFVFCAFLAHPSFSQKAESTEEQMATAVQRGRSLLRARDGENAVAVLEQAKKQFPDALPVRYVLSAAYFCRAVSVEDEAERPGKDLQAGAFLLKIAKQDPSGQFSQSQYATALRDYFQVTRQTFSRWTQSILQRERLLSAAEQEAKHILTTSDDTDTKILWAWLNAYRSLAAANWAKEREALFQNIHYLDRPLTPQEQECVARLDAQKGEEFQRQAVGLFLQATRQKPQDPAVYASFADCLILLSGTKSASRRVLYSLLDGDTSKISPLMPRSQLSVSLDNLSEEQVLSSPETFVPALYEKAIALDRQQRVPSARYGLATILMGAGVMDFAEAEKVLTNLQTSDPQNALYLIDQALLAWGGNRTQAADRLRSAVRSSTFRRELLTTPPNELIATLGMSQRVNDLLRQRIGAPYRRLFSEINKSIAQSQNPRDRIQQLFFKLSLAERFMQSHYLFDHLLGIEEKRAALQQLLALAPYMNPLEASTLRGKIFNFELATSNFKPPVNAWVLTGGGMWRGAGRDVDALIRNNSAVVVFDLGGSYVAAVVMKTVK